MAKVKEKQKVEVENRDKFSSMSKVEVAEFFGKTLRTLELWQTLPGGGMPKVPTGPGLPNMYDLRTCIKWAIKKGLWGDISVARQVDGDPLDLESERIRLTKEQADHAALKNAQLRRELIPASELRAVWEKVVINARSKLLVIPAKAHSLVGSEEKELKAVLSQWIEEALHELSRGSEPGLTAICSTAEADD